MLNAFPKTVRNISGLVIVIFILSACMVGQYRSIYEAQIIPTSKEGGVTYSPTYGLIIIPVQINGETYQFLFDTGFQTSAISQDLADKIGIKTNRKIKIVDSQGTRKKLPISIIDSLSIDHITFTKVGVFINDFDSTPLFSCFHIDGVIGANIIRLQNWSIDYLKNELSFSTKSFDTSGYKALPLSLNGGMPFLTLALNNTSEKFLVDIGYNGRTLSVSSKDKLGKIIHQTIGYASFGLFNQTKYDTTLYAISSLSADNHFKMDSVILNYSTRALPLIGNGFFENYCSKIYLDYQNEKLYLKRRNYQTEALFTYPFSPQLINEKIVVGLIDKNCTKLNIGDTILAINQYDIKNNSSCQLLESYSKSKQQKDTIRVVIKDQFGMVQSLSFFPVALKDKD